MTVEPATTSCTGGTGSDRFVFGPGFDADRITDFTVADTAEVIVFSGIAALDTWDEVSAALGHDGTWVTISGGTGNLITLEGVTATGSLTPVDFEFI